MQFMLLMALVPCFCYSLLMYTHLVCEGRLLLATIAVPAAQTKPLLLLGNHQCFDCNAAVLTQPYLAIAAHHNAPADSNSSRGKGQVEAVRARVLPAGALAAAAAAAAAGKGGKFGGISQQEFAAMAELLSTDADEDDFCPTCLEAYTDGECELLLLFHSCDMLCAFVACMYCCYLRVLLPQSSDDFQSTPPTFVKAVLSTALLPAACCCPCVCGFACRQPQNLHPLWSCIPHAVHLRLAGAQEHLPTV
jgi:hypothetical protein